MPNRNFHQNRNNLFIWKEKDYCFLCGSKLDITCHHIIPQREMLNNLPENIMILCKQCHVLIDKPKEKKTEKLYTQNQNKIDKYNHYLTINNFADKYFWVPKPIIKYKKILIPISHNNIKNSYQYKQYIEKKKIETQKKSRINTGVTPLMKKKLYGEHKQQGEQNAKNK